jgi:hypothetical protein
MIKITAQALIRIITEQGFKFIIEPSNEWTDKTVWMFVAALGYPSNVPFVNMGSDSDEVHKITASRCRHKANVLMLYDTKEQAVIGSCVVWHDILKKAKEKAEAKNQELLAV